MKNTKHISFTKALSKRIGSQWEFNLGYRFALAAILVTYLLCGWELGTANSPATRVHNQATEVDPLNHFQTGHFQTGQFQTGQFQTGQFQTGQFRAGRPATGWPEITFSKYRLAGQDAVVKPELKGCLRSDANQLNDGWRRTRTGWQRLEFQLPVKAPPLNFVQKATPLLWAVILWLFSTLVCVVWC